MSKTTFEKYLCFTKNLTLATRLIAFVGIAISVLLVTVLLNDLSSKNFIISRKIALGLGLDWRHIHSYVDTSENADPEGKIISALLIVYGFLFFMTNVLLLAGAIWEKPSFALPWLSCEFIGCLSKLIGLVYHFIIEADSLDSVFITGSFVYIFVIFWWWLVVYTAQENWREEKQSSFELSALNKNETAPELFNSILVNSPEPYRGNHFYTTI